MFLRVNYTVLGVGAFLLDVYVKFYVEAQQNFCLHMNDNGGELCRQVECFFDLKIHNGLLLV